MLSRTAQRLETSLLLSRQSLPRPARLSRHHLPRHTRQYSTPSKPAQAPATATVQLPSHEYPPYMQPSSSASTSTAQLGTSEVLSPFLARLEYTILPAPLPTNEHKNDPLFLTTAVQDQIAVMGACLHNEFNVPRAKMLFNRLREENPGILQAEMYNTVLSGYLSVAQKDETPKSRSEWVSDAWKLFNALVTGKERVEPNDTTFAIMLAGYHTFRPGSPMEYAGTDAMSYEQLMNMMEARNIDVVDVVANPAIPDHVAAEVVMDLSRAALAQNKISIVNKLGKATSIASGEVNDIPEARATMKPSKDGSEGEVPFNIQNLRDHLAYVAYARKVLPDDAVTRQRHLELSAYDMAENRCKAQIEALSELGIDNRFQDKFLQERMYRWHIKLEKRIAEEIKKIEGEEAKGKFRLQRKTELTPYLALVKPSRLSMIAILEVMQLTGTGGIASGMKTTRAVVGIGKAVEMEYKARVCQANHIPVPDITRPDTNNVFTEFGYSNLHQRRLVAAKQMTAGESWTASWSQLTRAQIGAILLECLMEVASVTRTVEDPLTGKKLEEQHPAFYHSYEYNRGVKLGVIKVNPAVSERIAKDTLKGTIHPRHLPMLHPPKPWVGANDGGYLFSKGDLMRFKDSIEQEKYLKEAIRRGNLELVMAGLNVLGQTPWNINKQIFHVVLEVWNSGERVGKLPPAVFEGAEPQQLSDEENDMRARSIYLQKHKQWQQNVANNHSDRCSTNYKIEIARAFLDETIYFPHNIDFRGRAYPLPPHLNHIGDDLSRGLLMFKEAKPLGERGLRWMKIHLANLYGFDKADFDERVEWVHERLDQIKDSAKNPLTGSGWWKKADDPWQCLATCMELTAALESPDPLAFASHLPVHQDGTCNGLQHYAAMGGDAQGAQQVNLSASDRPSDVYTFVGKKVEKLIDQDAARGDPYAKILQGKITRKVVKQTVMTTVYGVTFIGARDQLEGQLKDRGDIPLEDCWNVAGYLAKKVLTCIGDTFHGAKTIQNWLNLCARLIAKSISPERFIEASSTIKMPKRKAPGTQRFKKEQMTSVIWTTALGLPVVQPYRKTSRKQIMTNIQSVFISDPNIPNEVNASKQASAFPPNFVHSLDATHMLLTALECNRRNLVFASVHDSYWTHACDIDEMSSVIRDTFIELHSTDVLGRVQKEFNQRYKGYLVPVAYFSSQPGFQQKLHDAGTRIRVKAGQSDGLSGLEKLVQLSETSSIEERDFIPQEEADAIASEAAAESEHIEGADESPAANMNAALLNKFVDITELFPPLPEKGSFNVNDIRKSAYFFS